MPAPRLHVAPRVLAMAHESADSSSRSASHDPERQNDRGRQADAPGDVPSRGWLDILTRTKEELARDNLSIVAAGVAFYSFLAFVPALGAVIALYALISDPVQVSRHIESLAGIMPGEILPLLREQMTRLAEENQAAGVSAILPWLRSKSRVLKCSSSCFTWNVTAGWVMKSCSAAFVKESCFATV